MWYIHTVGHCTAIKRNKLLIHTTTGRERKSIMLNRRPETEETTYCMGPFIGNSRKGKAIGTESRPVVARVWGSQEGTD